MTPDTKKAKPTPHPLVERIRQALLLQIIELNARKVTLEKFSEASGLSVSTIGHFKNEKRKELSLDTFFKLLDALEKYGADIDRVELVQGKEDILAPKIKKILGGPHRVLFHKIIEIMDSREEYVDILGGTVEALYRQLERPGTAEVEEEKQAL